MRDYITALGSVLMMTSVAGLLIPEGAIKKFTSLAMGFMIITVIVSPIGNGGDIFEFDAESISLPEEILSSSQTSYENAVIDKHKENLCKMIQAHIKHGSPVAVEVNEKGELLGVDIITHGDESIAVAFIVKELGLPRERINLLCE